MADAITASFPPYDHIVDADEQQWCYYTTLVDAESPKNIAAKFNLDVREVLDSNRTRHRGLRATAQLHEGTLLVLGAPEQLLICSRCHAEARRWQPRPAAPCACRRRCRPSGRAQPLSRLHPT